MGKEREEKALAKEGLSITVKFSVMTSRASINLPSGVSQAVVGLTSPGLQYLQDHSMLKGFPENVIHDAIYIKQANRKTVTAKDNVYALKRRIDNH